VCERKKDKKKERKIVRKNDEGKIISQKEIDRERERERKREKIEKGEREKFAMFYDDKTAG
jgi:hypothetical protein